MKTTKRIWNKAELTIAYYLAKWDYNGLRIDEDDLVEGVIGKTTKPSLKMQMANFRHLLGIEGHQLSHASDAMKELVEELSNKTITQVRGMVIDTISKSGVSIDRAQKVRSNISINKRRDVLNKESEQTFFNKMRFLGKHRNLRAVSL